MKKTDLGTTISIKEIQEMDETTYAKAKNIADIEIANNKKNCDARWYSPDMQIAMGGDYLVNRAKYLAFKHSKFENEEYSTKCLIASNIAFNDDKGFVSLLMENGYTYGSLASLAIFIEKMNSLIKKISELKMDDLDLDLDCNELRHIQKIKNIMSKYYGINDYQLIANKIIEVVAKQKGLCAECSKQKTR